LGYGLLVPDQGVIFDLELGFDVQDIDPVQCQEQRGCVARTITILGVAVGEGGFAVDPAGVMEFAMKVGCKLPPCKAYQMATKAFGTVSPETQDGKLSFDLQVGVVNWSEENGQLVMGDVEYRNMTITATFTTDSLAARANAGIDTNGPTPTWGHPPIGTTLVMQPDYFYEVAGVLGPQGYMASDYPGISQVVSVGI
jgi:hypothetical protein